MIVQLRVLCQLLPQSIHCSRLSQHEQVVCLQPDDINTTFSANIF